MQQLTPRVPRVIGESSQVLRMEIQTLPTLRVEQIAPKIHVPEKHSNTPTKMMPFSISLEDQLMLRHHYIGTQLEENS